MKIINREKIWLKYDKNCAYCGEKLKSFTGKDMQVDHIIPQERFEWHIKTNPHKVPEFLKHLTIDDVNHFDNLNPSCRVCNIRKTDSSLDFFRDELQQQLERVNKTSANYRMAKKYGQVKETPKPIIFYFERELFKMAKISIGYFKNIKPTNHINT